MIITVCNQKGGSGKTSLSILIGLALTSQGKKVLMIDTDPQAGLTSFLSEHNEITLFHVLSNINKVSESIVNIKRDRFSFDLIPADHRLDSIFAGVNPFVMEKLLENIQGYDYIVIDTPPTLQGITQASCLISDKIFIPADISKASLKPTLYTIDKLKEIKKKGEVVLIGYKDPADKKGYIPDLSKTFMNEIKGNYAGTIPKNISHLKAIGDISKRWTNKQIDKILKPILKIVG